MKTILIFYLILINLFGFAIMGIDKRRAIRHRWRVPERVLFGTAVFLGSIGILTGMYVFRHKTRHLSFRLGIPAILAFQLILTGLLFSWNHSRMTSPSSAVQNELNRIRELDADTIQSFVSYENLTNSHIDAGVPGQETTDAVALFFKNFRYHIEQEQIDGDTASVLVTISNLDMHALAQDLCTEILKQSVAVSPTSNEMTTSDYYLLLYRTLSDGSYEKTETTAEFHLKKDGKNWSILTDEALEDALVSGFIGYMNDPYILSARTVLSLHLDALCELDAQHWKEYLNIDDLFSTYNSTYATQIDDAFSEALARCYDWEILKCSESGSTANAVVRITSLDMSAILQTYKKSLLEYAATTKSIRDDAFEFSNETSRLLLEAFEQTETTSATDLDFTFSNNGKSWEISFDSTFTNALMGDFSNALETFNLQ